jgi:hypothetical protein
MIHKALFIKIIQKKTLQGEYKDLSETTTLVTANEGWTYWGPMP